MRIHAPESHNSPGKQPRFLCRLVLVLYVILPLETVLAQPSARISDANVHSWYMYFGDHAFGQTRWELHFDGQVRRQGIGQKWQQLLLRPGVNYNLSNSVQVSAGYAFIKSYPYGVSPAAFVTPEHRIWQQLILKQTVRRARLAHRFRIEQRFVGVKEPGETGVPHLDRYSYRNRFRYFVKAIIPVAPQQRSSPYFLSLYNEVMFNWGRNVQNNIFDQNRAYVALGRRLPWFGNIEVGYLQQTVQQGNGRVFEFNHTLQVGLFSALPFGG